jgi:hypothetical protein
MRAEGEVFDNALSFPTETQKSKSRAMRNVAVSPKSKSTSTLQHIADADGVGYRAVVPSI